MVVYSTFFFVFIILMPLVLQGLCYTSRMILDLSFSVTLFGHHSVLEWFSCQSKWIYMHTIPLWCFLVVHSTMYYKSVNYSYIDRDAVFHFYAIIILKETFCTYIFIHMRQFYYRIHAIIRYVVQYDKRFCLKDYNKIFLKWMHNYFLVFNLISYMPFKEIYIYSKEINSGC